MQAGDIITAPTGERFTIRYLRRDPGTGLEYYGIRSLETGAYGFVWRYLVEVQ